MSQKGPSWGVWARVGLAIVGALAIFVLVRAVGPQKVLRTLLKAGPWLPLILALDFSWLAFEALALKLLYGKGADSVPRRMWVEGLFIHYLTFMVMPMGRASAEVARATVMAPYVGKSRAVAAATLMQSFSMMANAIVSGCGLLVIVGGTAHLPLMSAAGLNLGVTAAIGLSMYLVLRHVQIGGFLGQRFARLKRAVGDWDAEVQSSRSVHGLAVAVCVGARLVQSAQYGIVLLAAMGQTSLGGALIAETIQLVGRSAGDFIPNQVGVTEGAFALFSGALGVSADQAVTVALLARISNLSIVALCALCIQLRASRWFGPRAEVGQT